MIWAIKANVSRSNIRLLDSELNSDAFNYDLSCWGVV